MSVCACGAHVRNVSGRGRPRLFCGSCRPSVHVKIGANRPRSPRSCAVCNALFEALQNTKYCTPACKKTQDRLGGLARGLRYRQKIAANRPASSKKQAPERTVCCAHCGTNTVRRSWVKVVMYCSKNCKRLAWLEKSGLAAETRARATKRAARAVEVRRGRLAKADIANVNRMVRAAVAAIPKPDRQCKTCHGQLKARQRLFCSDACCRKSPAFKAAKRANKAMRRAKERGAEAERIDPMEIFERDGWLCQICGTKTPRLLRGTFKRNAPELDHRVPISPSHSGKHTRDNVQCACRQCNLEKSDKFVRGQLPLLGG